ncbi:5-oxoprolinase subunit PxpB [Alteromonas sp. C1M14]|uniref:5-oxoprolinase subunit PxpB n=1 Tax=Alteromonas sp. C1M14 TaxID=2841567 RepID=UPI001C092D2C|nr:5-oxoprolinase subunit PxpB [Alteromonas sp. C1M14]
MAPFDDIAHIEPAGLDGLILYFSGTCSREVNAKVASCYRALKYAKPQWLKEAIPAYDSLLVLFDLTITDSHGVYAFLRHMPLVLETEKSVKKHRIPVWYGASQANDLAQVCEHTGLTERDIIDLHTATTYRVYAVGFAPGFAYLGDSPEQLSVPRRDTPRTKVPAGAVAIADRQSAVYPSVSPGGWHLLGLSPMAMVDTTKAVAGRLQMGDEVTFFAIDEKQYRSWHEQ